MGLSRVEIDAIFAAALRSGLADPARRPLLLVDLPQKVVWGLPSQARPSDQLLSDLVALNAASAEGGARPIDVWLANAARLDQGREPLLSPRKVAPPPPVALALDPAELRRRLVDGWDRRELALLVADHFPEITGGLDAVVAGDAPLPYLAHELVEYCRRRRWLDRLAAAIDAR